MQEKDIRFPLSVGIVLKMMYGNKYQNIILINIDTCLEVIISRLTCMFKLIFIIESAFHFGNTV